MEPIPSALIAPKRNAALAEELTSLGEPTPVEESIPPKMPDPDFEFNPGQLSSLYPWYHGPKKHPEDPRPEPNSRKTGPKKARPRADVAIVDILDEDIGAVSALEDIDPDATIADDDPYQDVHLSRLPVGIKIEDIINVAERENFKKRMNIAVSTAVMAKSLDNEQVMWFLDDIKKNDPIAGYVDWDRVQRATAETRVSFGVEDMIRKAYIATEYPVNERNPNEAVDAYAVMENIYLSATNTRGDIKTYCSVDEETKAKLRWYRDLGHDIRARNIVAGIKKVEQKWKGVKPTRYRSITTLRRAFDYLSNIYHPIFPWPCSHAFFEATLDMLRVNEVYCMAVFEESTETFLKKFRAAMGDAEKRRMRDWIEAQSDEQFFDLMGTGMAPDFKDEIQVAPNPYSSAS
ncbi:hypothetical protein EG329_006353 [Mollisiaceae sp. DMI_Dod_QoI]|nr:hypothetical protein EG329_006353 [Helotiales sp. DMI_Dod_QoI]